jgi:hypothetical protein
LSDHAVTAGVEVPTITFKVAVVVAHTKSFIPAFTGTVVVGVVPTIPLVAVVDDAGSIVPAFTSTAVVGGPTIMFKVAVIDNAGSFLAAIFYRTG